MLTNSRKTLSSEKKNYESTNALLEVSKTLAKMKTDEGNNDKYISSFFEKNILIIVWHRFFNAKSGWKPSRTLVFCSFGLEDIENYSADSWSQKYLDIIKQRSVVYLNIKEPIQSNYIYFPVINNDYYKFLKIIFT